MRVYDGLLVIIYTKKSMTYSKDSLKKWSGGGTSVRTTYKVPTIKFNGNTGKLTKFPLGDFKNGTEITDVELVIVRPRRVFTSYEKVGTEAVRMFTNEHNTWEDHITVFEVKGQGKVKAIGSGHMEAIRAEFPSLRINSNLYCLYDGEIFKFSVKGKTRQALVDFQKSVAKDGTELFEKKVKLIPTQENGPAGNAYYFLKFDPIADSNLEEVGPFMEDMGKTFDKMDEEYDEKNAKMKKEAEVLNSVDEEDEDIVPLDEVGEPSDELKPEEIPF